MLHVVRPTSPLAHSRGCVWGVGDVDVCSTGMEIVPFSVHVNEVNPVPGPLISYEIRGLGTSRMPGTEDVRWGQVWPDLVGHHYPFGPGYGGYAEPQTPAWDPIDLRWEVHGEPDGDIQIDVPFDPIVEVRDPDSVLPGTCEEYDSIELCLQFANMAAQRRASADSMCAAGSGTFLLVPERHWDGDDYGAFTLLYRPMMLQGTGALTDAAWIASIAPVQGGGIALRAVRTHRQVVVEPDDSVRGVASVSAPIPAGGATFQPGVLTGGGSFLAVEVPGTTTLDIRANLGWTCGALQDHEEVSLPMGYGFVPSELGCGSLLAQRFSLRPAPAIAPTTLHLEVYGQPAVRRSLRLTNQPNGPLEFDGVLKGVRMRGAIVSHNATEMVLRLDEVTFGGVQVCAPGTYTLGPE